MRALFFFKQKTAYEMRISDWSSDVCSSDLSRQSKRCGSWSKGASWSVCPEEGLSLSKPRLEGPHRNVFETPFRQAQWLLRTNGLGFTWLPTPPAAAACGARRRVGRSPMPSRARRARSAGSPTRGCRCRSSDRLEERRRGKKG